MVWGRWLGVEWGYVLVFQNWSTWLVSIPALVILGVVHWNIKPKEREFFITDAQISYEFTNKDSINATVALVLQIAAWVIFVAISEFFQHRNNTWSRRVALFLHFLLDMFQSFFMSMMAQQTSAVAIGKWRPDFMGRCKPRYSDPSFYKDPAWMHPLTRQDCENPDNGYIIGGLWGFPSGHAQFVVTIWAHGAVYAIWTMYFRRKMNNFIQPPDSIAARLWKELIQAVVLVYLLGTFAWAYIVSLSRYMDNKHSMEDVMAGVMLGILFGSMYCIRAIGVSDMIPILHDTNVQLSGQQQSGKDLASQNGRDKVVSAGIYNDKDEPDQNA
eukprot:TRINITY_DN19232_c0_g1_i2.p1 TRINITY_DN19232_c0_g1~~TRINITY_DN19232_c0_g1_i2.p1  ORF type:complete len:328 (-),score=56.16 TRINITY_DN19232_c0_g1_i2:243-1226(-)